MSSFLKLSSLALFAVAVVSCKPAADTSATTAAGSTATTPLPHTAPVPTVSLPPETIIGTWLAADPSAKGSDQKMEFRKDGTFVQTYPAPLQGTKAEGHMKVEGTYKVNGDNYTQHITSVSVSSDAKEADVQQKIRQFNDDTSKGVKGEKDVPGKLQWRDKDNVRIMLSSTGPTAAPPVLTLKRKTS